MKQVLYNSNNYLDKYDEVKARLEEEFGSGVSDAMIEDEIFNMQDDDFEAFAEEVKFYFNLNDFVLVGSLGRWNGRYSVSKIIRSGWREFAEILVDFDSVEISDEDGHLIVECSDHDGSSRFELKELTQKGWEYLNVYDHFYKSEYEDAMTLWNNFYSRLPRLAQKLAGAEA